MRRLTVAFLVLVGACGGGHSPAQLITRAPAAAAARGSARVSLETIVRFGEGGQSFESITRGEAIEELAGRRRGHVTLTVTTNPASGVRLLPCEMESEGTVLYVKIPNGKRWASVDTAKIAGVDPSALSANPTAQLDYLKTADTVKSLGRDEVRGASATHFQYTVKVDQLMSKLSSNGREQTRAALRQLHISSFPLDVWIDDDGLPRRIAFDWKSTNQGATLDIATRIDTYDYGTKVDVALPTPSDVRPTNQPAAAFAECFGARAGSIAGAPTSGR